MPRTGPAPRRRDSRMRPTAPSAPRPRMLLPLAVLAALAVALAVRLWGVRFGLPSFLDEAIPFRKALGMWDPITGAIDWNPHFFHYPSLTLTLNLLLQQAHLLFGVTRGWFAGPPDYALAFQTDPAPMVIAARSLSIVFDALTVGCVVVIGERMRRGAGLLAGLMVALAPTLIESARTIQSDTVMAALALAAVERLLAWRARGGAARLATAVVLIGLATGAKYPGSVLLLPLALVLVLREGPRGLVRWPLAAAGAAGVFLLTTPYALLDHVSFVRDVDFVRGIAGSGHFGNLDRSGFAFQARTLAHDLGWPALALLAAAAALLALAVARRARGAAVAKDSPTPGPDADRAVLWVCALAFGVPIALAKVEAARYLVPVIPFVALLAADAALGLAALAGAPRRRALAGALAVALLAPVGWAGMRAAATDTYASRVEARAWIVSHLTERDLVLQEDYAAPVLERLRAAELRSSRLYAAASPRAQAEFAARPWRAAVTIPLAVVGTTSTTVHPANGPAATLTVVPHPADLNQAVYDPRLLEGVDWVVTSSAVRGRFEADPARYPVPRRFYALLDSTAEVAARFGSADGTRGPLLTVYRLGARTRAAVAALGPLPPLWWTETLSPSYRVDFERALLPPELRGAPAPLDPDGVPVAWVRSLRGLFAERYGAFALWLSMELSERGAFEPARRLADAIGTMDPADVTASLAAADAAIRLGAWEDARRALARTTRALEPRGEVPGIVRLQLAGVLEQQGDLAGARAELELVSAGSDPELAARAAAALRTRR